jgi:hypothetical protein
MKRTYSTLLPPTVSSQLVRARARAQSTTRPERRESLCVDGSRGHWRASHSPSIRNCSFAFGRNRFAMSFGSSWPSRSKGETSINGVSAARPGSGFRQRRLVVSGTVRIVVGCARAKNGRRGPGGRSGAASGEAGATEQFLVPFLPPRAQGETETVAAGGVTREGRSSVSSSDRRAGEGTCRRWRQGRFSRSKRGLGRAELRKI